MIGAQIGRSGTSIINRMVQALARSSISPNVLTVTGVCINVLCGLLFGFGYFFWAGIILIVANLFDMLDGQVARLSGRVTRFGGFLDSSLDRLSDMVAFTGLIVFYARDTAEHSTLNVFLAGVGLMGSVLVSYTSARAENLIPKCDVGFLRRPERVVLLIIGALSSYPASDNFFLNRMPAVLWVLAVGSFWTFAHRMYHTWREVQKIEVQKTEATPMTVQSDANDNAARSINTPPLAEAVLAHKATPTSGGVPAPNAHRETARGAS